MHATRNVKFPKDDEEEKNNMREKNSIICKVEKTWATIFVNKKSLHAEIVMARERSLITQLLDATGFVCVEK